MRGMGAADLLFITISHNVSFMGKTWWVLMLVLRLLVVLLAGFTLFSDEQERFVCNTIQPGCSNVCFDVFAPVSVLRLWLLHLLLLCLPHALFATYVLHKLSHHPHLGALYYWDGSGGRGGSPFAPENSSLHKPPLLDLPRFYGAYFLAVVLRVLLEVVFGAGQFFLFGLSVPKSFLCYEAPCTSGVECYVSRRTEKTLMLDFMLGAASLSVLLSLLDLASSAKAMVRWRRKKEMLMEEMSRGEQSSTFTTTTTDDGEGLSAGRPGPGGVPQPKGTRTLTPAGERGPENRDVSPVPPHFVLHSHLRPPLSPRPDRGPPVIPRTPTPMGVKNLGGTSSSQQSDSSESQDKRAWV